MEPPDTGPDFGHPYIPYAIQLDFMKQLFSDIEGGKVAVFESPTGTGKTLSLICGALTWLQTTSEKRNGLLATNPSALLSGCSIAKTAGSNEPDWVKEHALKNTNDQIRQSVEIYKDHRDALRERIRKARESIKPEPHVLFRSNLKRKAAFDDADDDALLSETDGSLSLEDAEQKPDALRDRQIKDPQIIFASRTHSQLSQFIAELKKTSFAKTVRVVASASRKNLCVNDDVLALGSATQINDKCLDMQQPGSKSCPYLKRDAALSFFADEMLARPQDIEELVQRGRSAHVCPYYASREANKDGQLLIVPYQLVLQQDARDSVHIEIDNNVVIFDEAHNLIDAINAAHTVTLSQQSLKLSLAQVTAYCGKYRERLSFSNKRHVQRVELLLKNLLLLFAQKPSQMSLLQTVGQFCANAGLDSFNFFKLDAFLQQSKLPFKASTIDLDAEPGNKSSLTTCSASDSKRHTRKVPLLALKSFCQRLNEPDEDGRIVIDYTESTITYTLLHPAHVFAPIVERARAVIFAGGTMSPVEHYVNQLVPYLDPKRVDFFSCEHVVAKENVLVLPVCTSPGNVNFEFKFETRQNMAMLDELGALLLNVAAIVPDGLVVFVSSFQFLDHLWTRWTATGVLAQFGKRKRKALREPTSALAVDATLRSYADAIYGQNEFEGAVLFSVLGGKMSEGINFSDRLARGVCVVGLPFPNIKSPVLREKINFLDATKSKVSGKEYYLNLCMRSVNQSIGRAIRHINDYAVILLVDVRFSTPKIQSLLPSWIRKSIPQELQASKGSFGRIVSLLGKFFRERRQRTHTTA